MCIYIYICVCICMCVYIYIYIYIYFCDVHRYRVYSIESSLSLSLNYMLFATSCSLRDAICIVIYVYSRLLDAITRAAETSRFTFCGCVKKRLGACQGEVGQNTRQHSYALLHFCSNSALFVGTHIHPARPSLNFSTSKPHTVGHRRMRGLINSRRFATGQGILH